MTDMAIRAAGLGKCYQIGSRPQAYRTLRDTLADAARTPLNYLRRSLWRNGDSQKPQPFWALRDVTFEIPRGEVVGIVGSNGAGKSTLLKILSRITEPTEGEADINGRVGSLLEVGTGFHPELSGRENVYLNGAILGMRRSEIQEQFDAIIAFAEVEKFIDTAVKHYSSGMYLRLAFAVAAHLEPEILLVDEVLAVGDASFQKKCLTKMGQVAEDGRTVLFVSHNMEAIRNLCSAAIMLKDGHVELQGTSHDVVRSYLARLIDTQSNSTRPGQANVRHWPVDAAADKPFYPIALTICASNGEPAASLPSHLPFSIRLDYEITTELRDLRVVLLLFSEAGDLVLLSCDVDDPKRYERCRYRQPGRYRNECHLPANLFAEGQFFVGIGAAVYGNYHFFREDHALTFKVDASRGVGSHWPEKIGAAFRPALNWTIEPLDVGDRISQG